MYSYEKELHVLTGRNSSVQGRTVRDGMDLSELSGKTIILSGATGMIGKFMIDFLMCCNDSRVFKTPVHMIALSRSEECARQRLARHFGKDTFRYVSCDVSREIPECGQADYVIHAASNTHPLQYARDSVGTIAANVLGTKNLLDYAVSHGTQRFCFLSSVEIYGENRGDTERFAEDYLGYLDCNTLRAGYPEGKRAGEALCNAYEQTHQLDFVIPRLSRVYGPTMLPSDTKAVSQFIKNAAAGEDIVLKSAGTQLYSYVYAADAMMGILTVLLRGNSGEAYNISDMESEVTLRQIAEWLAEDHGVRVVYEVPDAVEEKGYSTATKALMDVRKAASLGFCPATHMREGLLKTVSHLRNCF